MTDLIDKWKKDELPDGHYYVRDGENIIAECLDGYFYNDGQPMTSFSGGVDEVLAPVPTYEELQNINKSVNDLMASNIKLVEENTELKELLKECRDVAEFTKTIVNKHKWLDGVISKINQVLGEE